MAELTEAQEELRRLLTGDEIESEEDVRRIAANPDVVLRALGGRERRGHECDECGGVMDSWTLPHQDGRA